MKLYSKRSKLSFLCRRCANLWRKAATASLHKLAAGRKLATTHLNVSNRQMCGCTGFKSGSYNMMMAANLRPAANLCREAVVYWQYLGK